MKLSILVSVLYFAFWASNGFSSDTTISKINFSQTDVGLLDALNSENKSEFVENLELGGDPTVRFDDTQFGWVYCSATRRGYEEYLEEIIKKGFDLNFRQSQISPDISLPLSCAIRSNNLSAVKMLVHAGANPAETVCVNCNERFPSSLLSQSVLVRRFNISNWLVENGAYSYRQYETVVNLIERFPLPKSSSKLEGEIELVNRLRERGMEVSYDVK